MKVKFPKGFDEEMMAAQVKSEYLASEDMVDSKRQLFKKRYDLYLNIGDQKNKIYVRKIRSVMNTLLSLYYQDKINVRFSPRHFEDKMQARNLQNLAEFDYDEMDLAEKKYQVQRDKFFYGVGIEAYDGWDNVSKKPRVRVVDPRTRVPSRYDVNYGYTYQGFDMRVAGFELNRPRFLNTDKIKTDAEIAALREELSASETHTEEEWQLLLNLSRDIGQDGTGQVNGNETYSIYYHYTTFGGRKYLTIWGNERSLLIACEEIKAVREEEKKDFTKIPFPIVVRHYAPLRNDPYGESIPDILEDKQRAEQLFLNLNRIKAENDALGDLYLVDKGAGIDKNKFKSKSLGAKYIDADLAVNPNPVVAVPKSGITSDAYNLPGIISQQGNLDVGLDERSLGVSGGASITATENQRVQKNANLKLILGSRIDSWAEKRFWDVLWYRVYQQFFKLTDQKNILINRGAGRSPITVWKNDFVSKHDVDIKIITESEEKERKEERRESFNMLINYILQNPNSSDHAKQDALRTLYTLNGFTEEEANSFIEDTIDEMLSKQDLELLNRNEEPLAPQLNQDHRTFIAIYQQALDTDAKWKAIALREELFIKSGQQSMVREQTMANANSEDMGNTQSQLTSNAIQSSNKVDGVGLSA